MNSSHVIILLLLLGSVLPLYFFNKWSQQWLQPRRSMLRLLSWIIFMLLLVFICCFTLVWIVSQLFDPA